MRKILVAGGAGYIGSFVVRGLRNHNYEVFILDNFSSGHKDAVKGYKVFSLDLLSQPQLVKDLFKSNKFDGVVHLASFIQMGESFKNPGKYFTHNVQSSINLFEAMVEGGCTNIIFSSSAGVYGTPKKLPIKEDDSKNPENPYGETKLMVERILNWYFRAYGLRYVCLRYFNAAGANFDGTLGEDHPSESHIIPLMVKSALNKQTFNLFGNDYKTPDGTCVRDYVHVLDLAEAHVLSLNSLFNGSESEFYNVGIGRGYSNLEILHKLEKIAGKLSWDFKLRRPGDADMLYASVGKIKTKLKWQPKYSIYEILETAYKWHKKNPEGFAA